MSAIRVGIAAVALSAVVAGCGSGAGGSRETDGLRTVERDVAPSYTVPRDSRARLIIRMTRVQGDDPMPYSVDLHADRTAKVQFGGGHGGFEDKRIRLTAGEARRIHRALVAAPWRRVDGHAVTPGGFGGDDNGNRYTLFYGRWSTTLADGHIPRRMAPLIGLLDAVIDGDMGRVTFAARHSPIPVTPTPPG